MVRPWSARLRAGKVKGTVLLRDGFGKIKKIMTSSGRVTVLVQLGEVNRFPCVHPYHESSFFVRVVRCWYDDVMSRFELESSDDFPKVGVTSRCLGIRLLFQFFGRQTPVRVVRVSLQTKDTNILLACSQLTLFKKLDKTSTSNTAKPISSIRSPKCLASRRNICISPMTTLQSSSSSSGSVTVNEY